jgi:hypothetical protein
MRQDGGAANNQVANNLADVLLRLFREPIILYDLQEKKIYAYPYEEFKAELSKNSQASLERDYKSASDLESMVIFVRDNMERKLVSYIMSIDTITVQ